MNRAEFLRRFDTAQPQPRRRGNPTLDAQRVAQIRALLAVGVPPVRIAVAYGVNKTTVYAIRSGKAWREAA
jgi:hypothetical protein